ncbi:MAG: YtxH domain-containing protein [Bryobacteraceae bacterium]
MAESDGSNKLLWFIAGAALGVSAAMLLAPLTGEETRRKIAEKTEQGKTALAESGKDVFERGREMFERGQKLVDEAAEMFERGRRLVEGTSAVFQKQSGESH